MRTSTSSPAIEDDVTETKQPGLLDSVFHKADNAITSISSMVTTSKYDPVPSEVPKEATMTAATAERIVP